MKRYLTLLVGLLPLGLLKPRILNLLGHCVAEDARIAPSILLSKTLHLDSNCKINALNFIAVDRLVMRKGSMIGRMNFIRGRTSLWLKCGAEIGNRNKATRGYVPGKPQPSQLRIGAFSKLTADHTVDLGDSVIIAANTVLGGLSTQVWTHGFIHQPGTTERIYIRGKVIIGADCFIGSRCCISAGTYIADHVSVGAQSSLAGLLTEPGTYVSSKLRHIEKSSQARISGLLPIEGTENAFTKPVRK